ncbi:MAG: GntR family transcriptional regulator [Armatimonadetes bacterium]|nr:GntR family transcriptional regulator [Armatimonadota bacterium]
MGDPLYRIIYQKLLDRIGSGEYTRGSALPSEPKLAEEFEVSLITVRRAIHELVLDGLVESRQGIGHFVRDAERNSVVVGMSSFTCDVAAGRLRLVRTLMEDNLIPIPRDVAERLDVQTGSMLRHFVRLDCEGGTPLSVDEAFVPPALASEITPEIAASPLFLKLWQEKSGIDMASSEYEISVRTASEQDQRILGIDQNTVLLVTGELVKDGNGRPVLWVETRYRGDRCRLSGSVMLIPNGDNP